MSTQNIQNAQNAQNDQLDQQVNELIRKFKNNCIKIKHRLVVKLIMMLGFIECYYDKKENLEKLYKKNTNLIKILRYVNSNMEPSEFDKIKSYMPDLAYEWAGIYNKVMNRTGVWAIVELDNIHKIVTDYKRPSLEELLNINDEEEIEFTDFIKDLGKLLLPTCDSFEVLHKIKIENKCKILSNLSKEIKIDESTKGDKLEKTVDFIKSQYVKVCELDIDDIINTIKSIIKSEEYDRLNIYVKAAKNDDANNYNAGQSLRDLNTDVYRLTQLAYQSKRTDPKTVLYINDTVYVEQTLLKQHYADNFNEIDKKAIENRSIWLDNSYKIYTPAIARLNPLPTLKEKTEKLFKENNTSKCCCILSIKGTNGRTHDRPYYLRNNDILHIGPFRCDTKRTCITNGYWKDTKVLYLVSEKKNDNFHSEDIINGSIDNERSFKEPATFYNIASVIEGFREKHPRCKVICIVESREIIDWYRKLGEIIRQVIRPGNTKYVRNPIETARNDGDNIKSDVSKALLYDETDDESDEDDDIQLD